ncbi:hypothetical protein E8L99_05235 [Phreatobacter aquaticus]|uniref:Uncharacterized protein n=1 Tax=Phreatobacter aquaticus TaxID=2570229 RepID=A0A4D7QIF7_9HYPH|nr:hypothetical protein [Phreatobacter aquaticus]QCK85224.1 hypothetical protein E8L99_05235 [Phreatobacter aquaticus]
MTEAREPAPIGSLYPGDPELVKVQHAYEERKEIRLVGMGSVFFTDGGNMLMARGRDGMPTPAAQSYLDDLREKFIAGERWVTVRHGDSYQSISALVSGFRRQFELPLPPLPLWDRFRLAIGAARPHNRFPQFSPPPRSLSRLLRWLGQKELRERVPELEQGAAEKIAEFEANLRAGLVREMPGRDIRVPSRSRERP